MRSRVPGHAEEDLVSTGARLSLPMRAGILLAVLVPLLFALRGLLYPGGPPVFQYLAEAFLHGRLDVGQPLYDTAPFHGRYYVPLGPFPAILMMPLVAAGGAVVAGFWIEFAAVAVTLPALSAIFREIGVESNTDRALLCLGALAGTSYLSALVVNSPYYSASLVVVALLSWALLWSLQARRPFAVGMLIGLAALTRAPAFLALFPLGLLQAHQTQPHRGRAVAMVAAGVLPGVFLIVLYNQLRFSSPFESGYGLQTLTFPPLQAARAQGIFSPVHLMKNLYYLFLSPPVGGEQGPLLPGTPVRPSDWGTGLLWLSPWLLWAALARGRRAAMIALAALFVVLPSLLYYGIGWVQFGYRYAIDAVPFVAALAALGVQRTGKTLLFRVALAYSVVVAVLGAAWLLKRLGG